MLLHLIHEETDFVPLNFPLTNCFFLKNKTTRTHVLTPNWSTIVFDTNTQMSSSLLVPLAPAQIDKVSKAKLPAGMQVSKQARLALHKTAHCYLLLLASAVVESKMKAKKSIVTRQDVEAAVKSVGMEHLLHEVIE